MESNSWDPIQLHEDEVRALVEDAFAENRRVDGYFGSSRYFGAATPVKGPDGARAVRFVWLGPTETRGERTFLLQDAPQKAVIGLANSAQRRL